MKQTLSHLSIIVPVATLILFLNLGTPRLWDRDEPRNAGCAREMMERGDWVVPIFNDEMRHQKPVLLYWLIMSAYSLFGVNEFAARFWSAVLAIGTILATYAIGRRLFSPKIGLMAAVVLSTSTMFVVAGRAATPDSLLVFCSTTALMFFVLGTFASKQRSTGSVRLQREGHYFPKDWRWVVAMYAMMGLGVLAKGPVGLVLPCAIIGMYMLIQRTPVVDDDTWNSRGWFVRIAMAIVRPFHPKRFLATVWNMRPITAGIVVLGIAAPWYFIVGLGTDGQWTRMFFLNEHFGRATTAFESHGGGLWYYPLAILLGFFPWSVFLGPTLYGLDRQITMKHQWSPGFSFLLCWVGVQIGVFSIAQTKLPSYVTPCYPALALLTGVYLYRLVNHKRWSPRALSRLAFLSLFGAGLVATIALWLVGQEFLNGDRLTIFVGLVLVVGAAVAYRLFAIQRTKMAVATCFATAIAQAIGLFGLMSVQVDRHQESHLILDRIAASADNVSVATFGCLESSWVYYGAKPIYELSSEHRTERWCENRSHPWQKKDCPTPEQFVAARPNSLIITTKQDLERLQRRLPYDFEVIASSPYFLRDKTIVLLGNRDSTRMTHREPDRIDR